MDSEYGKGFEERNAASTGNVFQAVAKRSNFRRFTTTSTSPHPKPLALVIHNRHYSPTNAHEVASYSSFTS